MRGVKQISSDPILSSLISQDNVDFMDEVQPNPDISNLQTTIDKYSFESYDLIIGFGGGSAIDTAKVISVGLKAASQNYKLVDLLEKKSLLEAIDPIDVCAIPTTSGTGSEVTPFATIWNHQRKRKSSMSDRILFPKYAIIDPELMLNMPDQIALSTGLDAINQAAESIWNKNATPITIIHATRALQLGIDALQKLMNENDKSIKMHINMAESSLLAGLAISQTRTSLCHSISYPITAHFGVPHGLACAFTMPAVAELNMLIDDGRLHELQHDLGVKNLPDFFSQLNCSLSVDIAVKKSVGSLSNLLRLKGEMLTPGRADNNLATVDESVIDNILVRSWV